VKVKIQKNIHEKRKTCFGTSYCTDLGNAILFLSAKTSNSPSLTIFFIFGRILVLKGGKETSDLTEDFPPLQTQIGQKIKKIASDYFFAFPNIYEIRLKTGRFLTSFQKLVRNLPKTVFFSLCTLTDIQWISALNIFMPLAVPPPSESVDIFYGRPLTVFSHIFLNCAL